MPAWFSWLAWAGLVVGSIELVPHRHPIVRIVTGVLMALAALAAAVSTERHPPRTRTAGVLVATAAGLATIVLAPQGLGYVPVVICAGRLPYPPGSTPWRAFTVLDTLAFAAAVGWASRSVTGALAGVAIPVLVQRAAERREIVAQRDRARALLAEVQAGREAETHAAALRERGRIAREMHDVLAHSLAGLSLQLQAVRALAAKEGVSPAVSEPLDRAAELARAGLLEARAAVGALRDPIQLGLAEVPDLVRRHPGPARFEQHGEVGAVSPAAGHAVYRAVQEALTNAARYAPGSEVRVSLRWAPGQAQVEVADDGPQAGHAALAGQGTGLGLAGMQERLLDAGGQVRAGPHPRGGWLVELQIPAEAE